MEDTPLNLIGEKTPRTVVYKSESHKLCQAFSVVAGKTVKQGQPVKLSTNGLIEPYTGAEGEIYLGIALTNSVTPAYAAQANLPSEVTVMVSGFMICNWVSGAVLNAGYVQPDGTLLNDNFPKAVTSATATNFIALNSADAANEVIQVLVK